MCQLPHMRVQEAGPLKYYMHDDPDAFRIELAGGLTEAYLESVNHAWRTALSIVRGRPAIVDISFVEAIDSLGRDMLTRWHQNGARIVARSAKSRALAAGIPLETVPLLAPRNNWRRRLRLTRPLRGLFLRGHRGLL